ncbi:SDR family oxidoreductase [Dyella choica]|uniref:SDR family oxidoreductase n=1 Tax=Dyella choica TaxID=1927959 RepID=A0A3S0S2B4_9GAMM|nr:SDR family oxidoreductase [Dyella choica]RUL78780.1 SDR family oxidoreductase [Dyella choica]
MDLGLHDKVALVAGGSGGLGFAIAHELVKEGAHVAICGRDPERLAAAEDRLRSLGKGRVMAARVDVREAAAIPPWVDSVVQEFGRLNIVVTNNGGPPAGYPSQFDLAAYRAAADTSLFPAIQLALTTLPHLRAQGWGRLLIITSETVVRSIGDLTLSGVARAGLVRFAHGLVAELGASGVTVNVLAPAYLRTGPIERLAAQMAPRFAGDCEASMRALANHIPVGRVGEASEFAALAAFLASDRAGFITGTVQLVDGGACAAGGLPDHLTTVDPATIT